MFFPFIVNQTQKPTLLHNNVNIINVQVYSENVKFEKEYLTDDVPIVPTVLIVQNVYI